MNSFEINKIMGAVLGTLLFVMGVTFLGEAIFHPKPAEGPGYALPDTHAVAGTTAAPEAAAPVSLVASFLVNADAENGAALARRCTACHNVGEGEPHKAGPALYDIVGHVIGGQEGYAYSAALEGYAGRGETWTYDHLDAFLAGPQDFAPGSKMALSVSSAEDRADILAYLQTLSADPVPFPEPAAEGAADAGDVAAAAGEAAADDGADLAAGLRIAAASAENGVSIARRCSACHNLGEGEAHKAGPALYDIVGHTIGAQDGYAYSDGLAAHGAAGDTWTYANLDAFLAAPQEFAPGSKMALAVRDEFERADLIAYLRTLSAEPAPLPEAAQ